MVSFIPSYKTTITLHIQRTFNGYRDSSPGVKRRGLLLIAQLHLLPRLRMSGPTPPRPYMSAWCEHEQLYLFTWSIQISISHFPPTRAANPVHSAHLHLIIIIIYINKYLLCSSTLHSHISLLVNFPLFSRGDFWSAPCYQ